MVPKFNNDLLSIGFRISTGSTYHDLNPWADIEKILLQATSQFNDDSRLISLTFSWIKIHGSFVIVEKLLRLIKKSEKKQYQNLRWFTALAKFAFHNGLFKWKKLIEESSEPIYLPPEPIARSAISIKGEEPLFREINFHIPRGSIRIRESDILPPKNLIKINKRYRNRYLYGASWRAEIISAIQQGYDTPTKICNAIGCSYEPAHRILKEYRMATG